MAENQLDAREVANTMVFEGLWLRDLGGIGWVAQWAAEVAAACGLDNNLQRHLVVRGKQRQPYGKMELHVLCISIQTTRKCFYI